MPIAQFSGLATGIDSAALIDAIIEARETTNIIRRNEIEHLKSESDSLEELNTKLLALNDLVDRFRSINGGGLLKSASSSDSSVATALAGSNATNGSYAITVNTVADTATASFDDSYSSLSDPFAPNAVGTQTIGADFGTAPTSIDVDITSATTVQGYIDAFNSDPNASGRAVASAVNVGTTASPDYRVVITSLNSGLDEGSIAFDIPTGPAGFGGNSDLQNRTIDQASDADFNLGGIGSPITRSSNTVSDVVTGVTFNLLSAGNTDVTVADDQDGTADLVKEIVDAYNDVVSFVSENDLVQVVDGGADDGNTNIFGSLAKTRVDDDFLSAFRLEIAGATSVNGSLVKSTSQMGILTERDGTLSFDADKFKEAMASDSIGVGEVLQDFADSVSGINGVISQYTRFNGLIDIAKKANDSEIKNLNDEIEQLERFNADFRQSLELRFARLEGISAGLQSQQNTLTTLLSSFG